MQYYKYHALGNDYLVIDPADFENPIDLTPIQIQRICHRNYGVGSDGILLGPWRQKEKENAKFALNIFNPDGSEAEKSGNGLRIFSRFLWDKGLVGEEPFAIDTKGGRVQAQVQKKGKQVSVEMGKVSFDSEKIPVEGPAREVLQEKITVAGEELTFCAATIGNPHCVILQDEISPERTHQLGPLLENDPRFPNRTNVQFLKILDRSNIQVEIWERGAGYTLASGSSSSAAATVAHKLGLCDDHIKVHMPGGIIDIRIFDNFSVIMCGSVTRVSEGKFFMEMFD